MSELSPSSTNLPDNLLCDLAIISVLDLQRGENESERQGREEGRIGDVDMMVYRTGSAGGDEGSGDLCALPSLSALRTSSSILIDPLWLMSPVAGGIKLQRSHTSQGERTAGVSDAEEVSRDDKRVQVSDKMRAARGKHQKGKASGLVGS